MKKRKIEFKKVVLGFAAMAGAFVLASCGNTDDTGSDSNDTGGTADSETVNITFWHAMTGPHQDAITELVDAFNDSQDQFIVEEQNQGDYDTLLQSIMASGSSGDLPTLSQVTPGNVPDLASNQLLVPLDDLLISDSGFTQDELDDIYPGFMDSSIYEGMTYAMPFSKSTRIMFYNQDILDEYDVEVPATWDEVEALGELMEEDEEGRIAIGFENSYEMEYETIARQNGADFIDSETLETAIDSPESVDALTFLIDLIDQGYARTAGEDGFFSGPFARGESALYIGSSAGIAHVAAPAEENGISWGTAEIPTYNDTQLTLFAGNDLAVFASATEEEQEAAVAFIKFLLEPENTAEWAMATGYVPIRRSALEVSAYQEFLQENPTAEAANLELEYGISETTFVGFGEYRNALLETLDNILVNDADIQESLTGLDEEANRIIEANNE